MLAEVAIAPPAWKAQSTPRLGAPAVLSVESVVADVLATFCRYVGQSCETGAFAECAWAWVGRATVRALAGAVTSVTAPSTAAARTAARDRQDRIMPGPSRAWSECHVVECGRAQ